ncbi:MAG TPA: cupin domain-containing protein [Chthoniobacterales bacterium]|nr:cupin domain-containing protein [Chthoniobacterales bacterium]
MVSSAGPVGAERPTLRNGDVLLIPAGVKHRFVNVGSTAAVTFNVYSPPEYPPGEKG